MPLDIISGMGTVYGPGAVHELALRSLLLLTVRSDSRDAESPLKMKGPASLVVLFRLGGVGGFPIVAVILAGIGFVVAVPTGLSWTRRRLRRRLFHPGRRD